MAIGLPFFLLRAVDADAGASWKPYGMRPARSPRTRFAFSAAFVRALPISRSCSANASTILRINTLDGSSSLVPSPAADSMRPRFLPISRSIDADTIGSRASRSRLATISTESLVMAAMASSSAGRASKPAAPLTPGSLWTLHSVKPFFVQCCWMACSCASSPA